MRSADATPAVDLSLAFLRSAYRQGSLTPRRLLHELLARARTLNGHYHLYIHLLDEAALEPYLAALEARDPASLPLYGVPFAIKDNIDLAGAPTTAACPTYAYAPERSASVVQRLIELGAVPTGKTNLDQFATGLNGQRSPYGGCPNPFHADYPSGGSSSGSALAVSLGLASFSLGTDTAGSGRVPAALNGLVGCKPTRGLLSIEGLVPCCRSLDCVSIFARQATEAAELLALAAQHHPEQAWSRHNPAWNARPIGGAPAPFRFGVPRAGQLQWLGCTESPALFERARERLEALGGSAVEVDFQPFLDAATLLYAPAGTAERQAGFGDFVAAHPDEVLPVIREVLAPGALASAVDRVRSDQQLAEFKRLCDRTLEALDLMLIPTIPRAWTLAQIEAEPVLRNSELGLYTNFVNLLDYAAVAVPAGQLGNGLPWGVTLLGRAFTDQYLLGLAAAFQQPKAIAGSARPGDRMRVVVCGAHLQGLALNHQLVERGGRLVRATHSAPNYRLYALPGGPPQRPAMVRAADGVAIEVEVWELLSTEMGSLLAAIGAPLGLGKVVLADGTLETGFICEHGALAGAEDISVHGGWRAWLATQART
ncbi:allophanate hydrolase [Hydrocarboniphaga effusa]|uniref:Allophanate hydrolase n=1 Tax=Hydrocarboniphaga effusa AP103 TaxID=1172194 RepID=I8T6F1_9GAMM|nr:allophanate hydrolase [Hydrocarboniphaga effusa]EIT69495.1 allophanate hydrolase [Hydrocarboniphaga effusa AP103]